MVCGFVEDPWVCGVWCVVCGFVEDLWCGGWKLISIEFSAEERGKEGSTVRERGVTTHYFQWRLNFWSNSCCQENGSNVLSVRHIY